MRKLSINMQVSLDGVIQGPGMPDEDTEGGFDQGGWAMPFYDPRSMGENSVLSSGSTGALLIGRKTYDIFARYWPHQGDDVDFARFMNGVQKYVASRTLTEPLDWENSTLLKGDVADEVGRLKEEGGGDIVMLGSSDLAQTLMDHDLIDSYELWIVPISLGKGKRLFREGRPPKKLELVRNETSGTGVLLTSYRPA